MRHIESSLFGLVVIVLGVGLWACGKESDSGTVAAKGVVAAPCSSKIHVVEKQSTGKHLDISGVTEPIRRIMPASRFLAKVLAANFVEGERVKVDQLLVRLDGGDLEAKRRQALAGREAAQTATRIADKNLERMKTLYASQSTALVNVEQIEMSQAQALAAKANANAAIDELDMNLGYVVFKAPFAGVITRKMVEVGSTVAPGYPVFLLEDDSRLRVIAAVASDILGDLKPGQALQVRFNDRWTEGKVEGVISSGDPRSPGFRVQVIVDNTKHDFKAGTLAVVSIPAPASDPTREEIRLPGEVLNEYGQMSAVYVVDDRHVAHLRYVLVEAGTGSERRLISGLKPGERIAYAPQTACLKDGAPIEEAADGR